jgi:hypothetical protein
MPVILVPGSGGGGDVGGAGVGGTLTLLDLVQNFCEEMGIAAPSTVITSTDQQVLQILRILNRLGRDIARLNDWQRLNTLAVITTTTTATTGNTTANSAVITGIPSTAGLSTAYAVTGTGIAPFALIDSVDSATQVTLNMPNTATGTGVALTFAKVQYDLPSDWLKQIPQTEWDRTGNWQLSGPVSPQEWQKFQSGVAYSGPRMRFRIHNNTVYVDPPPSANLTLAYEYVSSGWVIDTDGSSRKGAFAVDTDTCIFDDSLMMEGLILRWNKRKGFAYDERDFNHLLSNCMAQDTSARKLSLAPARRSVLLGGANVADGNWPSS